MAVRYVVAVAIVALALGEACNAQHMSTSILHERYVKSERFKGVKTFEVGLIGAWDHPDREKLQRIAKAEARRLLAGIAFKATPPQGQEFDRTWAEGSHMNVIVDVKLAWSEDASRPYTGASVETAFIVRKKGATDEPQTDKPLPNLARTEAQTVVACHRDRLIEEVEMAIRKNFEVLSHGFFESR